MQSMPHSVLAMLRTYISLQLRLGIILMPGLTILTGCAAPHYDTLRLYESVWRAPFLPPTKTKEEVATLNIKHPSASVDLIDGINIGNRQFATKGMIGANRLALVEMLPGPRKVQISYREVIAYDSPPGTITYLVSATPHLHSFNAVAGRMYRITVKSNGLTWESFIEDITMGETNLIIVSSQGKPTTDRSNTAEALRQIQQISEEASKHDMDK